MARLIFTDAVFTGQVFELRQEKTLIGRGEKNHLIIPEASVSVEHCMILVNGPEVLICELDSHNGTYVDGARISKQIQIKAGQVVQIGTATARLELAAEDEVSENEEMTAISGYRRALQRPGGPTAPAAVGPTKLASPAPINAQEETVTLKRPPAAPARDVPIKSVARPHGARPESEPSRAGLWIGLTIAALLLMSAFVYWALIAKR